MAVPRFVPLVAIFAMAGAHLMMGQARLRIFIEPFENSGGPALRAELVKMLSERKEFVLVDREADADRVLSGEGETHVKGYLSQNPRVRYINRDSRAVYKGFLSVELRDTHGDPLWSYIATPRRYGPEEVNRNLAGQILDKLLLFLSKSAPPRTP